MNVLLPHFITFMPINTLSFTSRYNLLEMTMAHLVVKRSLHTSTLKCRGAVTHQGWFPRDHMPGNYPKTEEERRLAAMKYGLRPEDYRPYDPNDALNHMGDYPDVGIVTYSHKDPYEAYTDPLFRRNWCEPVARQFVRYRPDRWSYNGLDEEKYEFRYYWAKALAHLVPVFLLVIIIYPYCEELNKLKGYYTVKYKVPKLPKQYPIDYYRAFPYENPEKYPVLNYSFERAEKLDAETDNAQLPFNPTQRGSLEH